MAKKINVEIYFDKAQNGARVLFDLDTDYRLLDGVKDDVESYFLIEFTGEEDENIFYELSLKEVYDLLTLYVCDEVDEDTLYEAIQALQESSQ